jgi:hypothetical protein
MEGIAAFGLAANILQMVELGNKLLSTGQEIYQAGTTVQNSELEVVLKDLTVLNTGLQSQGGLVPHSSKPIAADEHVRCIVHGMTHLSNEMRRVSIAWHSRAKRSHRNSPPSSKIYVLVLVHQDGKALLKASDPSGVRKRLKRPRAVWT